MLSVGAELLKGDDAILILGRSATIERPFIDPIRKKLLVLYFIVIF